ncbi:MAG: AMP-binding protein [Sphingomonadaceae bacterium]
MTDPAWTPPNWAGPDWAARLDRHAERIALVPEGGEPLTYAGLLALADSLAAGLGPTRRLVALEFATDINSIAGYLACLRGGHPVILLPPGQPHARIEQAFAPDAWLRPGEPPRLAATPADGLHPALAVLLSTSGSTGSPKLVRLAGAAVAANAAQILAYLDIDPGERALTTLPFHYSYGLSVLNSHLMAGASLALTDRSLGDPALPAFLEASQPTSMAGVPTSYELLLRTGLAERLPPSFRTLTQAGGRLAPDRVRALAALGRDRGFRFIPMYGQTEATARMAWLRPELVDLHPDCIGEPIPGGAFHLVDPEGRPITAPGTAGELVYRGPNIMMGYAERRADLERGPELSELRTGDIAERTPDGLYRIVGRASRFAKVAGLRVGFDDLEALLAADGIRATVTGQDGLIVVHAGEGEAPSAARLAARLGLPATTLAVIDGPLPLLPSGKPDYAALRAAGTAALEKGHASGLDEPVLAAFRRQFPGRAIAGDTSFHALGGDSLAWVELAIALEAILGPLPDGWDRMPIAALAAGADEGQPPDAVVEASEADRPRIRAFNQRLAAGGSGWSFYDYPVPRWLPPAGGDRPARQHLLFVDGAGEVRGAYVLRSDPARLDGEAVRLGSTQGPVSEALVDPAFARVGPALMRDALDRLPLQIGWGTAPRKFEMLVRAGWPATRLPLQWLAPDGARLAQAIGRARGGGAGRLLALAGRLGLASATTGAAALGARLAAGIGPGAATAERQPGFGPWADSIWQATIGRPDMRLVADRTAAALGHAMPPGGWPEAWPVLVREGDRPIGWVAFAERHLEAHRRLGDARVLLVVDALALPGREAEVMQAALAATDPGRFDLVLAAFSHRAWRRALRSAGFLDTPARRALLFSPALARHLGPPGAVAGDLHLSLIDADGPRLL